MLPTIKNKVEYSNNIQNQVVARIHESVTVTDTITTAKDIAKQYKQAKASGDKELQAKKGLSVRQAEDMIKANKRAELKAARLQKQDEARMGRKISQLKNKKW